MSKLKMGVIGAGMISRSAAKSINKHADAEIVAAFDPSEKRLGELREENNIPRGHSTIESFLEDDFDAVYVAVPNKFHAPTAIQVLESGRHCVLDKPFALNYAEAKSVIDTANRVGKTFMVAMNQRFTPSGQRVRHLIKDGALGDIYHAKGAWMRRDGIPKFQTWFGHKALSGGGCLLDIGVHILDVTLWMVDNFEPVSVLGSTYTKFGNRGIGEGTWGLSDRDPSLTFDVDDFASALITFKNGMTLQLDVSWAAFQETSGVQRSQIYGTEAGASLDPAKLFKRDDKGEYRTFGVGDEGAGEGEQTEAIGVPLKYPHCDRFHNFINAVLGREEIACKHSEVLVVQKILDSIYESSRTGKQVMIES